MYQHILVPIDGSKTAERGLQEAIRLAGGLKATLHLLNVIDAYPMEAELESARSYEQTMERLRRRGEDVLATGCQAASVAGVSVQSQQRVVHQSTTADAILEEAAKGGCDLIVMGTHGRHGWRRLAMGSTAEEVLRRSRLPTLMVRQPTAA
jgi:nucleotide-binding universal stress UspA family protein